MPKSGKIYLKLGYKQIKPSDRLNSKDLWAGEHLNEARYSIFKKEVKTRTPQQQLHEGVKAIQRRLDDADVIGVAETIEIAKEMIKQYYGEYKIISFRDVRDSGIEFDMCIQPKDEFEYNVTVMDFNLNQI